MRFLRSSRMLLVFPSLPLRPYGAELGGKTSCFVRGGLRALTLRAELLFHDGGKPVD